MGTPLVTAGLSDSTAARISACGHHITYHSPDGAHRGRWSCGSTWCSWCAKSRRDRAAAIIRARIEQAATSVYLVTLSIPHIADYSASYLRDRIAAIAAMWRDSMSRIRWALHHDKRGNINPWRKVLPPMRNGGIHGDYAKTWCGRWNATLSAGVWAREITTGGDVKGWHCHIHVLVQTLDDAEMLNAAWQRAAVTAGEVPHGRWTSTDIKEVSWGKGVAYVSKYLAKTDAWQLPPHLHEAYVQGTKGMRRCDAWGDWRPLGLRREKGETTHVSVGGDRVAVDVGVYWGEDELSRWVRYGHLPDDPGAYAGKNSPKWLRAEWPSEVVDSLRHQAEGCEDVRALIRRAGLAVCLSLGRAIRLCDGGVASVGIVGDVGRSVLCASEVTGCVVSARLTRQDMTCNVAGSTCIRKKRSEIDADATEETA